MNKNPILLRGEIDMDKQFVYTFSEGTKEMKSLLGGKGANLAEMTNIGLPVPPGFTISTEACKKYSENDEKMWPSLKEDIDLHIKEVENAIGKKFADPDNPLLFSVRSGAADSMPGMMDTILNLGLNNESVKGLAKATQNKRFAYDSYRRFIEMFSDVAMGIPKVHFDRLLEKKKKEKGVELDTDLDAEDLEQLVEEYLNVYEEERSETFPQDPTEQLYKAVSAVFSSWNNPRAVIYRKLNNLSDALGTAVNIQSMVFGNMGKTSGTGVMFTRNPSTGERKFFGEFLLNAQGEDVVAGVRTPQELATLKKLMPDMYDQLEEAALRLEHHYRDMQDIEFTIEKNQLYFLQTRTGKRTAYSALTIAVDLQKEGLISKKEAVARIQPEQLEQILHPMFEKEALEEATSISKGLAASPGAATGAIYFDSADVEKAYEKGISAILVRQETSPEDISGMVKAEGILTSRGGMTSHAAVVARGMGKCCVAGCSSFQVSETDKTVRYDGGILYEGDILSIDGATGKVYEGSIQKIEPELGGVFEEFMSWVDEIKTLNVRANADTPEGARQALKFGAEGIGLVRTEHMFFAEDRINAMRQMILSYTIEEREEALEKLLPMQREDFYHMYKTMQERPMTIRLLDPPLHEFLPTDQEEIADLAQSMSMSNEELSRRVRSLQETNPMLGHRGVRLAVTYPEIALMQVKAIIEAALKAKKESDISVNLEIMIPLVGDVKELSFLKTVIEKEISDLFEEGKESVSYSIGTMIEVPRAALLANHIAEEAEFFSFGTNDLTQMGFGFSRDDAGSFISEYLEKGILVHDPFQSIDEEGIGELVKIAARNARKVKPKMKLGICGEHGGDPKSITFFHKIGLDYVSCSPYRVPVARLAAAQAALDKNG